MVTRDPPYTMERKDEGYQDSVRTLLLPTILKVCAQGMHSEPEPVLICFSISVINMNQKQVGEEKFISSLRLPSIKKGGLEEPGGRNWNRGVLNIYWLARHGFLI